MAVVWQEHLLLYDRVAKGASAYEVGGGAVRSFLPADRVAFLDGRADFILSLQNILPQPDYSSKWDDVVAETIEHVRVEYRNADFKVVGGEMCRLPKFLQAEGQELQAEVGNTTVNPSVNNMITFRLPRSNGTIASIRLSELDFPGDRRSGPNVTRLQQVVRTCDGKLFDRATGTLITVEEVKDVTEQMPLNFFEVSEKLVGEDDFITQFGRFILNNVRLYGHINGDQADLYQSGATWWVRPDGYYITPDEKKKYLTKDVRSMAELMLSGIGYTREISPTLSEFRYRMIASFLISPRLFMDLSRAYGIYVAFPNLATAASNRFYEGVDYFSPVDLDELKSIVKRDIMGSHYDEALGLTANIGRMFALFPIEADGCIAYNNK